MRGLVGFLTKTIVKVVKTEKVVSIYWLGLVSFKIFCMWKQLYCGKFLVDGKFGTGEFFVTCELVVVEKSWDVR